MKSAKITYEDGSSEVVAIKPRHFAAAEEVLGVNVGSHLYSAGLLAAHAATGTATPFEAWLDTVDDFEQSEQDPTTAGPSPAE